MEDNKRAHYFVQWWLATRGARALYYYCDWPGCKTFSQWERCFLWKLCCHWLKGLRQHEIAVVIQSLGVSSYGTDIVLAQYTPSSWWRHQMETYSALLAICAGNSPVPGEFPTQRPVTRSFDVFFDLRLNKRLSKQLWSWWFETLSRPLWRHRNDNQIVKHNLIAIHRFLGINLINLLTPRVSKLLLIAWFYDRFDYFPTNKYACCEPASTL